MFPLFVVLGTDAVYQKQSLFNSREQSTDSGKMNLLPPSLSIGVLQEIAQRCCSKVWVIGFGSVASSLSLLSIVQPMDLMVYHYISKCRLNSDPLLAPVSICSFQLRLVDYFFLPFFSIMKSSIQVFNRQWVRCQVTGLQVLVLLLVHTLCHGTWLWLHNWSNAIEL